VLIGLAGAKRSGKDTAANLLASRYGFERESFAGPIRRFIAQTLGLSAEALESVKESPIDWLPGFTPRLLMQTVGTEWGRNTVHPDLWILSAMRRVYALQGLGARGVVLTDVRFANEANAIRDGGGFVLRLNRTAARSEDSHASEVRLADHLIDAEVSNDGTIQDLRVNLDAVMLRLGVEPVYIHG